MNRPTSSNAPLSSIDLPTPARVFLTRQGMGGRVLERFEADASPRRYFRVVGEGVLLMEERRDPTGFAAYLRLSHHLNLLGLSAPKVFGADPVHGLALVEDFGDGTYTACLARGDDETELYELAIDTLLHLHHAPRGKMVAQSQFDMPMLLDELGIFARWFAPAVVPHLQVDQFTDRFLSLWHQALITVATRWDTLVMRDFHVDNLMRLDGRTGIARCGVLDFQDGVLGPCEYDLVSLLQDARRDLSDGLEEAMLARYLAHAPHHLGGPDDIRHRYALLGAQRHARILGVFVRLCLRDGKPRYLRFLPRVLAQFRTALSNAGLGEIEAFLDTELPDWTTKALDLEHTLATNQGVSHA
ncbi:phosphotransferase [Aliisedimentitalea scapharcae]|uniref:Phosphotransferase n=1 Tax=Aliisedimentitalea scapharcae TaxID=1524259 RepID=A0ABZ2XY10_9RHOB